MEILVFQQVGFLLPSSSALFQLDNLVSVQEPLRHREI
ncbi:hypothetical protein [Acinetobacter bereziniae]|nr:hypothetical protein [Acinetobacter bereziniae]